MQTQTREEIESAIEECKEAIYQHRYALRWFTFGIRTFWLGTAITLIIIVLLIPLNLTILHSILESICIFSAILSVVVGATIGVLYMNESMTYSNPPIRENRQELREAKRTLAKLLRRLAYYDEHAFNHLSTPEQYMHQLPTLIISYRKRADRFRWWFIVTQIIIILLSATITSLSGGWLDKYISVPWTIPVFSALISVLTSFTLFLSSEKKERISNKRQTLWFWNIRLAV